MIKIDSSDSAKISHLVRTFDNHRAVIEAVTNGYEKGWIIVDDDEKSRCFFIHQSGGYFFLHGTPGTGFIEQISEYLYEDLKLECIEVVISEPALEKLIPAVFGNRRYKVFQRKVFHLNLAKFETLSKLGPAKLPGNYQVQVANDESALSIAILANNKVVSKCRAIIGTKEIEISIETAEKHRRKGYAMYTAQELIKKALERDMVPVWSCWTFNDASIGLANKLGFEEIGLVNVYLWDIY